MNTNMSQLYSYWEAKLDDLQGNFLLKLLYSLNNTALNTDLHVKFICVPNIIWSLVLWNHQARFWSLPMHLKRVDRHWKQKEYHIGSFLFLCNVSLIFNDFLFPQTKGRHLFLTYANTPEPFSSRTCVGVSFHHGDKTHGIITFQGRKSMLAHSS